MVGKEILGFFWQYPKFCPKNVNKVLISLLPTYWLLILWKNSKNSWTVYICYDFVTKARIIDEGLQKDFMLLPADISPKEKLEE